MFTKRNICSFIVILFHLVGLYGFLDSELTGHFITLVPFHLLLMLALMIISGYDGSSRIILFAVLIYLSGFAIEVAGVNTGFVFGSYTYGNTLGFKVWKTPLLIGVNWLILVYTTGIVLSVYRLNKYLLAFCGAAILVLIDYLIEPVAIHYDYWAWTGRVVPLQNYLGWFVVSFLLFLFFASSEFRKQNSSAIVLFVAQVCFFMILNNWVS